jgi:hypothetical protein
MTTQTPKRCTYCDGFDQRRLLCDECWAAAGGPVGCLGGDDVVRGVTIKAMFSVGPCFAS